MSMSAPSRRCRSEHMTIALPPPQAKHVPWEPVQQGGQERPIARVEPRPGRTQLPLQDRDLVM